jgi:hypothetical protein
MANQQYYIRERGRVVGPFSVAMLKEMRRRNQLARFHLVSGDGRTWVRAETLEEVFRPNRDPTHDAASELKTAADGATGWFYHDGSELRGPVQTEVLQELIDRGALGPDVPVRPEGSAQWSICRDAGTFRFDSIPSATPVGPTPGPVKPSGQHRGSRMGRLLLGSAVALTLTIIIGSSAILWYTTRVKPTSELPVAVAQPAPAKAPDPPATKKPEPKPKPANEAPKPVAKVEPEPEPGPDSPPVRAVRFANVKLPTASSNLTQHDGEAHELKIALPTAQIYALRLRGLDDPELQRLQLVSRTTEPGRAAELTIIRDRVKSGGEPAIRGKAQELARFWVNEGRLYFQWAQTITEALKEPSRALRDCILEVCGGSERVIVALRDLVSDRHELSALDGRKSISWKDGSFKPLVIRACQVRDTENTWRDIPEGPDRRTRELVISPPQNAQGEKAVLRVRLAGEGVELSADVRPSIKAIGEEIKRLSYGEARLKKQHKALDEQLREVTMEIHAAQVQLERAREYAARALQNQQLTELGPNQSGDNPEVVAANAAVAGAKASVENRQTARSSLTQEKTRVHGEATSLQDEIRAKREMKSLVDKWIKVPIRVRIGAEIDGEKIDVMQIGPW